LASFTPVLLASLVSPSILLDIRRWLLLWLHFSNAAADDAADAVIYRGVVVVIVAHIG
jgi:hypothetical protein